MDLEKESASTPAGGVPSPSGRPMKDAAIALGILILGILLWKLMTHPEQLGSAGPWLKTNVFGLSGIGLAESLGVPAGNGTAGGTQQPEIDGKFPLEPNQASANPDSSIARNKSGKPDHSSVSNNPITIISDFSEEPTQTNHQTLPVELTSAGPDAMAMARRLHEEGAKGGDLQFSLFWRNQNDLDLHCVDPRGVEIYYSNKRSDLTGGELDVDQNAHEPYNSAPVENIYWPRAGASPGIYKIFVDYYAQHDFTDPTTYTVRTVVQDKTNFFRHTIVYGGQRNSHWICTIQYDPANPVATNRCRFLPSS